VQFVSIGDLLLGKVVVAGSVTVRGRVEELATDSTGVLLRLRDDTGSILVAFPGSLPDMAVGQRVEVVGQYLNQGIFADHVRATGLVRRLTATWESLLVAIAASWVLALALLVLVLRITSRYRRQAAWRGT